MARPRTSGRRCSFESLENRRMLAGDVTAQIKNGDLVIKGDDLANGITITAGTTAGTVIVAGVNAGGAATTINGGSANGSVTLSGFTGDLKINLKGGNDTVSITGLTVSDDLELKASDGDDTVTINDLTIHDKLKANLGKGSDTLTIDSTTVTGKTHIRGRSGEDDATITDSTFTKLKVSLGDDDDSLDVSDTTVTGKTRFNGRGDTNTYNDGGGNSLANLKIKHFNQTSEENPDDGSDALNLNTVSAISENGKATVTGNFVDSVLTSAHTVVFTWGDTNKSASSTFAVPATSSLTTGQTITSSTDSATLTITSISGGQVNFSVQHQYLNDGPAPGNSTTSDTSTITGTVTSAAGFNETDTTTVVVNNTTATVALNAPAAVNEGNFATLTGNFTDAGTLDSHSMAINWGDANNSVASTFSVPAIFNAAGTQTLTVGLTINSSTDSAVLTITAVDTTTGKVTFSTTHAYLDDGVANASGSNGTANDVSNISVAVTDLDGQTGTGLTTVTVNNSAPVLALNAPASVFVGSSATLTGSYTDLGLLDQHPLQVNWGDNSSHQFQIPAIRNAAGQVTLTVGTTVTSATGNITLTTTAVNPVTGQVSFSVPHQYSSAGNDLVISVTVIDDDTGTDTETTTIDVVGLT